MNSQPETDGGNGVWPWPAIGRVDFYQYGFFDGLAGDGVDYHGDCLFLVYLVVGINIVCHPVAERGQLLFRWEEMRGI